MPDDQITIPAPPIHPCIVEAWRAGEVSFPAGPDRAPAWWPWGPRRAYADGRWHARWTSEPQERANG